MTARARRPPAPDPSWAWFLDVDGTLAELAPSPELARVDDAMCARIDQLRQTSGGAVAFVSGRPIAEVDAMLGASGHVAAGLHGHEWRGATGELWRAEVDVASLQRARERIMTIVATHPQLRLEDKGSMLALHYRAVPALASFVHRTMREAQQLAGAAFMLQRGKRVVELKPAGQDKGTAIARIMGDPPFRGRVPVYVGDDATDEHAFAVVNAMGGHSVKVGRGASGARWRLPDVSAVREWLARIDAPSATAAAT